MTMWWCPGDSVMVSWTPGDVWWCPGDSVMVQRLFHDAKVTAVMDRYWREQHQSAK